MSGETMAWLGYLGGASVYVMSVVGREAYRAAVEQRKFDESDTTFTLVVAGLIWPLALPAFCCYVAATALGERGRRMRDERAFQLRKEKAQVAQLERELALESKR